MRKAALALICFVIGIAAADAAGGGGPTTGYVLMAGYPAGGIAVTSGLMGNHSTPYGMSNSAYGASIPGMPSCSCTGQTTWKWQWMGPGAPPVNAIIQVKAVANCTCSSGSFTCDNGYEDNVSGPAPYYTSAGFHYIVYNNPGQSFYLQLTPVATCTGPGCAVSTTMTPTPVMLSVSGGINPYGSNSQIGSTDECLVGQYNVATISAGSYLGNPAGGQGLGASWQVSLSGSGLGSPTLAQSVNWGGQAPTLGTVSHPPVHTWTALPGSFQTSGLSAAWFATGGGAEQIQATAQAYDPNGNALGTVSATYTMQAVQTYGTMSLTPGQATSGLLYLNSGNAETAPGMTIEYAITTPSAFVTREGQGHQMLGQLTNFYECAVITLVPVWMSSGGWSLDNSFQYEQCDLTGTGITTDSDTPNLPDAAATLVTIGDYFKDFAVYYPPNNGVGCEFVPVYGQAWQWVMGPCSPLPFGAAPCPTVGGCIGSPVTQFQWTQLYMNPINGG
ncbi:MAG: hypothetical protein P4L46_03555 [Fimbriimonas sp.]|nr:hypothetical protein [Fimbriimonas sp.]